MGFGCHRCRPQCHIRSSCFRADVRNEQPVITGYGWPRGLASRPSRALNRGSFNPEGERLPTLSTSRIALICGLRLFVSRRVGPEQHSRKLPCRRPSAFSIMISSGVLPEAATAAWRSAVALLNTSEPTFHEIYWSFHEGSRHVSAANPKRRSSPRR
jgi:hypothetical protein